MTTYGIQSYPDDAQAYLYGAAVQTGLAGSSLHTILTSLGLTSGLKLCLDVADIASYPGTGQKWLDRSGGGYDFFRGGTSGAEAFDPTFNGTAGGLSSGEYWSFDGGDIFRYDTANEAWMQNLHKDNAKWSFLSAVYPGSVSATDQGIFGDSESGSGPGVKCFFDTSGLTLQVKNGVSDALLTDSVGVPTATAWNILGLSLDEAAGATGLVFFVNGAESPVNGAYNSPSASSSDQEFAIGECGGTSKLLLTGARMGFFAMWEGVALTALQLGSVYSSIKSRYGL